LDGDGDVDVVVSQNHGPARVLLNQWGQDSSWIGFRLVAPNGGRDMLGARVAVGLTDGRTLWRRCYSDGSYLSASDPRILVGLGEAEGIERVEVHWPDGSAETWRDLVPRRVHLLRQGEGRIWSETTP
ncbi:MAG: ASPIC/UnbV domain-containing protein, partial [Acidobacteria bacterium]|nr:ASPIC/UnbV domain-containing protein [Acidobacteriota bacterium]